ncbi:hypothetical protein M0802_010356 [Mischocyttarus mexicanus]|nr:hypothetical protein M0802_010356 [Mischocyttarus mexicanus]
MGKNSDREGAEAKQHAEPELFEVARATNLTDAKVRADVSREAGESCYRSRTYVPLEKRIRTLDCVEPILGQSASCAPNDVSKPFTKGPANALLNTTTTTTTVSWVPAATTLKPTTTLTTNNDYKTTEYQTLLHCYVECTAMTDLLNR